MHLIGFLWKGDSSWKFSGPNSIHLVNFYMPNMQADMPFCSLSSLLWSVSNVCKYSRKHGRATICDYCGKTSGYSAQLVRGSHNGAVKFCRHRNDRLNYDTLQNLTTVVIEGFIQCIRDNCAAKMPSSCGRNMDIFTWNMRFTLTNVPTRSDI